MITSVHDTSSSNNDQWCRVYTRTHVARKHVSRTSNLYPDTYMSTDTRRRIHIAGSGYMLTVSRRHNYYSFMSRSTCITLYPCSNRRATNWRQFYRWYEKHVDGDKWIQVDTTCVRQHVSWCKRGLSASVTEYRIIDSPAVLQRELPELTPANDKHKWPTAVSIFCTNQPPAMHALRLTATVLEKTILFCLAYQTIWHFRDFLGCNISAI